MASSWFVTISVLFGLIYLLYWLLYCKFPSRLSEMTLKLPGPKPLPFIGNMMYLRYAGSGKFMGVLTKLVTDYGSLVKLSVPYKAAVLLSHPDDVQSVLGNPSIKNRSKIFTSAANLYMGNGLVTNRDEVWRSHRKIMTPLFHFKILELYMDVFVKKGKDLVRKLDQVADGRSFDVYGYISSCTLEAILETAIGSSGTSKDCLGIFPQNIEASLETFYCRMLFHAALPEWMHCMLLSTPYERHLTKTMRKVCQDVISQSIIDYRSGVRNQGITTSTGTKITSFLDMMVEASESQGSTFSAKDIEDEVITMVMAGMETTATTMAFALLLLAIHPDIQDQIRKEMTDIFGEDTRPPTSADLNRMVVLGRVVKETLRMFPTVPAIPRELSEDITLKNGHVLPKECHAYVLTYFLHRNEEFYEDPCRWWPDRWLPENNPPSHPYAYLPFSAGSRNCIGQKYAMLQMKTTLSTVLRRYDVTTNYKMEDLNHLDLSFVLKLKWPQGYEIQIKKHLYST